MLQVFISFTAAERGEVCSLTLHPEPTLHGAADLSVCLHCRKEEGEGSGLNWERQGLEPAWCGGACDSPGEFFKHNILFLDYYTGGWSSWYASMLFCEHTHLNGVLHLTAVPPRDIMWMHEFIVLSIIYRRWSLVIHVCNYYITRWTYCTPGGSGLEWTCFPGSIIYYVIITILC